MEDFFSRYEALKKAHEAEALKLQVAHQAVGIDLNSLSNRQSEHRFTQQQASYLSSALALEETHRNTLVALSYEIEAYQTALRRMQSELVLSLARSEAKIINLKNEADELVQQDTKLSPSIQAVGLTPG